MTAVDCGATGEDPKRDIDGRTIIGTLCEQERKVHDELLTYLRLNRGGDILGYDEGGLSNRIETLPYGDGQTLVIHMAVVGEQHIVRIVNGRW
jgi:hypothetical protein